MRWHALPGGARVVLVLVALVVALNAGIWLVDNATTGAERVGDDSDPSSTAPNGTAAWVDLLRVNGHEVDRTDALPARLDPDGTVVVLDARVRDDEAEVVRDFADAGGHVVVGGPASDTLLAVLLVDPPVWDPLGTDRATSAASRPETEGISAVEASGHGSWVDPTSTIPLLEGDGHVIAAAEGTPGAPVVALADTSVVQNRFLAEADNAAFALNIVGAGSVTFVETGGADGPTGLAAIPGRWWLALAGLVVAFLVGAVATGRRVGPPDPTSARAQPPRRRYVDAVGLALERTRRPAEALLGLQRHAREGLALRAGLRPDATDEELRAAAGRLGWPQDEIDAVLAPATGATMIAAGRALSRVTASETSRMRTDEGADR